ncbi:hypothetical protein ACHAWF_013446 [Thalassiosira exigua]
MQTKYLHDLHLKSDAMNTTLFGRITMRLSPRRFGTSPQLFGRTPREPIARRSLRKTSPLLFASIDEIHHVERILLLVASSDPSHDQDRSDAAQYQPQNDQQGDDPDRNSRLRFAHRERRLNHAPLQIFLRMSIVRKALNLGQHSVVSVRDGLSDDGSKFRARYVHIKVDFHNAIRRSDDVPNFDERDVQIGNSRQHVFVTSYEVHHQLVHLHLVVSKVKSDRDRYDFVRANLKRSVLGPSDASPLLTRSSSTNLIFSELIRSLRLIKMRFRINIISSFISITSTVVGRPPMLNFKGTTWNSSSCSGASVGEAVTGWHLSV